MFGTLVPGKCPEKCSCCSRKPVPWRFAEFNIVELKNLAKSPALDENGKTFQPLFQYSGVAYACTWAEHELRGHTGRKDHPNWETGKPTPDFKRFSINIKIS